MVMVEQLVDDWLTECKNCEDLHSVKVLHNDDLANSIHLLFEDQAKWNKVESVCIHLFSLYQLDEAEFKVFTLQFLPALIYFYLSSLSKSNREAKCSTELLLLGMYNLEVSGSDGKPKTHSFRMPSLAQASVYHDPHHLLVNVLTENALRRLELSPKVQWGPYLQYKTITASNRQEVMALLVSQYNKHLSRYSKNSLRYMCGFVSKLVKSGFGEPNTKRISLSSDLLLELVQSIYFLMFHDLKSQAEKTLMDVDARARYELYNEVMLVTNAIKNSVKRNGTGGFSGLQKGVDVTTSPIQSHWSKLSKTLITNASFKTKKLPDDIPIQPAARDDTPDSSKTLISITEEDTTPKVKKSASKGRNDVENKRLAAALEDDGFVSEESGSDAGSGVFISSTTHSTV